MAQAIVNNLENLTTGFVQPEKSADVDVNQFSKILEVKKNDNNISQEKESTSDEKSQINTQINIDTDSTATKNSDLKEEIKETANTVLEAVCEVVKEATSDMPLNFALFQDEEVSSDTAENMPEADEKAEKIENTTTDTITNEDSTMNREQQILTPPPENPAVLLTFQNERNQLRQIINDEKNDKPQNLQELNLNLKKEETQTSFKNFNLFENEKDRVFVEDLPENDEVITKTESTKLSDYIEDAIVEELNIESVESDISGNQQNSSDLMQNQSPQEQGLKAVIQGNVKFDDISVKVSNNSSTELNSGRILEQISKQMENMYNGSKVNIVLNPEALGKIALQVLNSKEGLVAQFTVTNQDIKDILMKGLAGLKESLLSHGVSVDSVTVKLADAGDSEYSGDWTDAEGSRGGFKEHNSKHQKDEKKQFEKMMFEIENNGNV